MLHLMIIKGKKRIRIRINRSCRVTLCDPLDDINVMLDYENNLKLIMKDEKGYKNTLQ